MCGIAGIVSDNENGASRLLRPMLQTMRHRGPDGAGFVIGGIVERRNRLEELDFEGKKGHMALGHVRLAITGEASALQPFQSRDGRLSLLHNGEIYNHQQLRSSLRNECTFDTNSDSEVILRLVEKHYRGDLTTAVQKILPDLDGVYALAVTDNKQTVIARDRIGVRQLYVCRNGDHVAFASEKKPLLAISDRDVEIQRLLPGHVATLEGKNFHTASFWAPESIRPTAHIADKEEALQTYGQAMKEAIRKRSAGRTQVGIIFSGGIDSVLIAYIVQQLGIPFTCYTAGRGQDAVDVAWARRLAKQFGFPLKTKTLTIEDIEGLVPEIIRDIEDHSLNQVEVAVPIYASVRMAQEAGERVILTGQGADELFGGYPWYANIVDQEGYENFEQRSWEDTFLLYKECLEREDKIAMAHSLELRVPYLDPAVIRIAFQIAPELKIQRGNDLLGKRIHRDYCVSIGIPPEIAFRKKEAAQHGANVHTAFEELADGNGVTASMLRDVGYDPDQSVIEKLGSSSRYGFRYGDQHLWEPTPHVQYYLDSQAARLDLLPPPTKRLWERTTRRLETRRARASGGTS